MKRGFTVIELLVVVAVIGLLFSIALVSFRGTREKASLAQKQQFASQVNHALGAYALGIWQFDEGSGATANDSSGSGNEGAISGGAIWVTDESQCVFRNCLSFDGLDDYVESALSDTVGSGTRTLAAWVKVTTPVGSYTDSILDWAQAWNTNRFQLVAERESQGNPWAVVLFDAASNPQSSFRWGTVDNSWHHVAFVLDRENGQIHGYEDGALKNSAGITIGALSGTRTWLIGKSRVLSNEKFKGVIDDVRIFSEALSVSQIRQLYVQGLPAHLIAQEQ